MLHVVHHADYRAPKPESGSFKFDKYYLVMESLREGGAPVTVHAPPEMPREWLEAVHAPDYVDAVLNACVPREIERRIGFPVTPAISKRVRHTSGGTWLAAKLALLHGYAANSAGGSHHAKADGGAGYCVFNDLAIAANRLIAEGDARRILIVDLDVHQGDGTAALTEGQDDIVTFSMHCESNFPVRKAISNHDIPLADKMSDAEYLDILGRALPSLLDAQRPDIVLYQAGVDPHRDDRLGRLALSDAGLDTRDRFVMAEAKRRRIPVASALGGGYGDDQRAVADRHARSMLAMADQNRRADADHALSPCPRPL